MNKITLELNEDDALLFKAFREHQENFSILLAAGVFNIRAGHARLDFDLTGTLCGVTVDIPTFRRGHKQLQFISTGEESE